MFKFCIHEQHAGVCEKTGGYCSEGPCPHEDIRDFIIANDACQNCVHARPIQKLKYQHACQHYNGPNCNLTYFRNENKKGIIINILHTFKTKFESLGLGEVFIINESEVCIKIGWNNECNTWNFMAKDIQTVANDTEVIVPEELNTWKMVPRSYS